MDVFAKESTEQEIQGLGWWDDVAVIKSDGACAQIRFLTVEVVFYYGVNGSHAVLPVDLLAFPIRTSVVGNANLSLFSTAALRTASTIFSIVFFSL